MEIASMYVMKNRTSMDHFYLMKNKIIGEYIEYEQIKVNFIKLAKKIINFLELFMFLNVILTRTVSNTIKYTNHGMGNSFKGTRYSYENYCIDGSEGVGIWMS